MEDVTETTTILREFCSFSLSWAMNEHVDWLCASSSSYKSICAVTIIFVLRIFFCNLSIFFIRYVFVLRTERKCKRACRSKKPVREKCGPLALAGVLQGGCTGTGARRVYAYDPNAGQCRQFLQCEVGSHVFR